MKQGDTMPYDSVRSIRPGFGIPPKHLEDIIGKKINRNIALGTPVKFEFLT